MSKHTQEQWRPVPGYEGIYDVSDHGRVRSVSRKALRKDGRPLSVSGRILTANPNGRGYPRVTLNFNGTSKWSSVHSLVATTFLRKPPGKIGTYRTGYVVNHKDGDKTNNHVSNLEYIAALANISHARASGALSAKGERNNKAKLCADDVRAIREEYSRGTRQKDLAAKYGIAQTGISSIVRRKTWSHIL